MPVVNMWCAQSAEAEDADAEQRADHPAVADERRARHRRQDHRDHAGRGQEDDVDLGMAEQPEQVLPEHRVAALRGDEERPVEGALQLEQQRGEDHRREAEHDHAADHQHRPGVDRHAPERHARRARAQDADDQLDRAGDRRDLDEADAEQPEVGAEPGRVLVPVSGGYMNQPPSGATPKNSVPKKISPPIA